MEFNDGKEYYSSSYNFPFIFSIMDNKLYAVHKSRF